MRCTNCGRDHALQTATEVDVGLNGAPTVLRCRSCDATERHRGPERRSEDNHVHVPSPAELIDIEEARARTAVLQAEMSRLM
jgi:hypothetical protein